jgi:hypothetical protein
MYSLGILIQCKPQSEIVNKINGLSFVASRDTIQQKHIEPVLKMHANWVSIMPFGFMKNVDSPELHYNHPNQWYGERMAGVRQSIAMMHKSGIKVMLKPQIWIGNGDFTGYILMRSEEDWQIFEGQYQTMVLDFAKVAEEMNVEILSIGTELNAFVEERPHFWEELILSVQEVYSGQLTYAENWDKIDNVPFWSDLDFIGVDAYFPVSEQKTANLAEVKNRWKILNRQLKLWSEAHQQPILFTEFGYRSIDFAGKEPWDSRRIEGQINEEAQAVLLQALFESVWDKDWFAGGFLWKWFHEPDEYKVWQENRFSVFTKKAQKIVSDNFLKYN